MTATRLRWLDAFRGVAAIVVVAYHLSGALGLPRIRFGFLAVDLFFVLSGIVIGQRYETAIRSGMTASTFAWCRARRLYPMVLVAAALIAAEMAFGLGNRPYATFTGGTLLSLLSLVPYPTAFGAGTAFPANPAVWSLSAELLANALWFGLIRRSRRAVFIGGSIAMAVFLAFAVRHGNLDVGARAGIGDHVAGWAAALAWFTVGYAISIYRPRPRVPTSALLAAFAACCAICQVALFNALLSEFLVVASGTALMASLMHAEPRNAAIARACTWLGMLSYPLYMVHLPASRLAEWAVANGATSAAAHVAIVLSVAVAATIANEAVVQRLPAKLRWRIASPGNQLS